MPILTFKWVGKSRGSCLKAQSSALALLMTSSSVADRGKVLGQLNVYFIQGSKVLRCS